ncbi:Fe-S cluster assembly protein IscX [Thiohalorhabdus methylotrophus]|uniref:Fe-S cluster assembly protein IscX n=1 Tax=Thiohalorhabdus methylotrophus TaxID=3242694 RepID=A0ABV4TU44_9GAMM
MKWTDIQDIAVELAETMPDVDPQYITYEELRDLVTQLEGFDDDPNRVDDQELQAIQLSWIDEAAQNEE